MRRTSTLVVVLFIWEQAKVFYYIKFESDRLRGREKKKQPRQSQPGKIILTSLLISDKLDGRLVVPIIDNK